MAQHKRIRASKAGIAMPLVLLMTALLGFTLLAVISALVGLRRETLQAKASAEFERAAMTAEARFTFLALTEPLGPDGVYVGGVRVPGDSGLTATVPDMTADGVVLGMDHRLYRWREQASAADYRVVVQDEAGLVNLYQADQAMLLRLFLAAGLPEGDAQTLADELIAYNAEPELHQPMRRPAEIYRLDSAAKLLTDRFWRNLAELVVSYPDNRSVNINTASAQVLKVWFDIADKQADEIVRNRTIPSGVKGGNTIYASPGELGLPAVPGQTYAFTGGRLRFKFTDPASGDTYQSSLVLTPNHVERPVWIENAQTRHLKPQSDPDDELQDFPEIPRLAA